MNFNVRVCLTQASRASNVSVSGDFWRFNLEPMLSQKEKQSYSAEKELILSFTATIMLSS